MLGNREEKASFKKPSPILHLGARLYDVLPYSGEDIRYLRESFKNFGVYNLPHPLYDLSDEKTEKLYSDCIKKAKPMMSPIEISCWKEITSYVKAHIEKYGNRSLIIIEGTPRYIWGAVPQLEDSYGLSYISTTPFKLKTNAWRRLNLEIEIDMLRNLGIVKFLGYKDIREYLEAREKNKVENIAIGIERANFHPSHTKEKLIYKVLNEFLLKIKPGSVLYIGESLNTDELKEAIVRSENKSKGSELLVKAKRLGLPVSIGTFPYRIINVLLI
ncbi:MAG: hypothetical protein QW040_02445 [Candidatus Aenigmatarchaeota archaeon]